MEYSQLEGRTIRVIDYSGRELKNQQEVAQADQVFLAFVDKINSKNNFTLPVSKEPKIGYITFDTCKWKDKDGNTLRERHIGNKVVDIKFTSPI